MNDKIILFDIDGTIFNDSFFIDEFYKNLVKAFGLTDQNIKKIKSIYEDSKKENGYFLPSSFLNKITQQFPSIDKNKLQKIFWNIDLFNKSVYKDTEIIKSMGNLVVIGIFSKGDREFQNYKLSFIRDLLDTEDTYIFTNKIDKLPQVLGNYPDYKIYLVDDDIDVLIKAKELDPDIFAILVDRNNSYKENKNIANIKQLNELKSIIYD